MAASKELCFPAGRGRMYGDLVVLVFVVATVATLVAQFGR
jgi:hypothetical protein